MLFQHVFAADCGRKALEIELNWEKIGPTFPQTIVSIVPRSRRGDPDSEPPPLEFLQKSGYRIREWG